MRIMNIKYLSIRFGLSTPRKLHYCDSFEVCWADTHPVHSRRYYVTDGLELAMEFGASSGIDA
jgi:hypothetical protein